jgi:hypothetical protein
MLPKARPEQRVQSVRVLDSTLAAAVIGCRERTHRLPGSRWKHCQGTRSQRHEEDSNCCDFPVLLLQCADPVLLLKELSSRNGGHEELSSRT